MHRVGSRPDAASRSEQEKQKGNRVPRRRQPRRTAKILTDMGHRFGPPHPANHVAAILVGAPALGGKPVAGMRFFGANDPRRNYSGLALGY